MPCNSIRTTQIDLSKANVDVLASALTALGFEVTHDASAIHASNKNGSSVVWQKGVGTTVRASRSDVGLADKIAPAYSGAALKKAAKKYGWNWKQSKSDMNKFEVERR